MGKYGRCEDYILAHEVPIPHSNYDYRNIRADLERISQSLDELTPLSAAAQPQPRVKTYNHRLHVKDNRIRAMSTGKVRSRAHLHAILLRDGCRCFLVGSAECLTPNVTPNVTPSVNPSVSPRVIPNVISNVIPVWPPRSDALLHPRA